ncbi:hypothetical protein [Cohnella candidum]|uniref:Cytochrome c oxidase subunit II n=1 Tax=Cohnella candidum TaxID=2674991 RepID=A0A3G3K0A9_9BACL|nr:hypothetical protein [Cohnella candidum]AYQ73936.1 hypothetical protein EAV92_15935 [Cohnella candidum]
MGTTGTIILIVCVMAVALIATFWVGFSKENKEENAAYDAKPLAKWKRLLWIYAATLVAVVAVFFLLLRK